MAFIEPCFGIGHNLSLICQMTSEDIKHQLIISDIHLLRFMNRLNPRKAGVVSELARSCVYVCVGWGGGGGVGVGRLVHKG